MDEPVLKPPYYHPYQQMMEESYILLSSRCQISSNILVFGRYNKVQNKRNFI